jgi:hypothetical protein
VFGVARGGTRRALPVAAADRTRSIAFVSIVRAEEVEGVSAVMPLRASAAGGSGSFLVLADDGRRYWCKSLNNFQGPRIPVTEQIVGRLAALIGAPACEVALVRRDPIAGWEFRPSSGRVVEKGWAHGSVAVDPAVETRSLDHRSDDDNRRRHCGIYALCDWLAGSDVQWLYGVSEDNAYYSHDHGFYLTGPEWTLATLAAGQDAPFTLSVPADQLDAGELTRLASVLDALSRQEIEHELSKLPGDWPVADDELAAVADFVVHRRGPVAARLRAVVA